MKLFLTILFTISLASANEAQPAKVIIFTEGAPKEVYLIEANARGITYTANANSTKKEVMAKSAIKSIFFYTPPLYKQGLEAMRKGDFKEASGLFKQLKVEYSKVESIKGNYGTLAEFYEIECARRAFDFKTMVKLADSFNPKSLQNKHHRDQADLYPVWKILEKKNWKNLTQETAEFSSQKLIKGLKAQLSYCAGIGFLNQGKIEDAMYHFNAILGLSNNQEPELTVAAAKEVINAILAKDAVQEVKRNSGEKDGKKSSPALTELTKAVTIAQYLDTHSFFDAKLTKEQKELLKLKL